MPFASYDDAVAWWFGRVNYEQRTPRRDDLKLDQVKALLRRLGDPHERLRIIHVAGSKGKGSTSAMLATILRRAGYRTGLFTSPHLHRVEERIQVDGVPITLNELIALLDDVRAAVDTSPALEPTFFEVATALGFLHFRRRHVDAAVVEVGLGGRFDSTNVCRPLVSIITSISLDHTQQLGDRLASIAAEKAGIIKPGRPVINGTIVPEAREVIEAVARARRAPLTQLDRDFRYEYTPGQVSAESTILPRVHIVSTARQEWPPMVLGLLGEHQAANAALVVRCVELLRDEGWHIATAAVAAGLANVSWPARMQVVSRRPLVVLDCAHNVASAEALIATLLSGFPPVKRWLIFAGSADKDLSGILRILAPHFNHVFLTRYGSSARGMPVEGLADLLSGVSDIPHTLCSTPHEAWLAARTLAAADDLVCATGSVFLAGELLSVSVPEDTLAYASG
jgi:dihydrofolate synthase / folylpolyglutamate synthase